MSIILEVQDLVKYYGAGENMVKAVDHTNLVIERGKFTAIVGRSGSGKSTLLHLLGGLDRPDSGKVLIEQKDIYTWKDDKLAKFRREKIGLADKKRAMPNTLSGGQKQRTAIARALAANPAIILADEPTGNLDSQTELEVVNLLKQCVKQFGQTLVMITHDETIAQMADVVIVIEDGKVVSQS